MLSFKDYYKLYKKLKKKSNPLPQTDKSTLTTSADLQPTQQLPAASGGNQPSLS